VNARTGSPDSRLMLILVIVAIVIGVAFGYWLFTSF
jgi:uncharacterized protein YneF (UPF0154 family)